MLKGERYDIWQEYSMNTNNMISDRSDGLVGEEKENKKSVRKLKLSMLEDLNWEICEAKWILISRKVARVKSLSTFSDLCVLIVSLFQKGVRTYVYLLYICFRRGYIILFETLHRVQKRNIIIILSKYLWYTCILTDIMHSIANCFEL